MKVILQKDVKDLGKVGDLVSVSEGFARNFLFPRKLALEATEKRVKEFEHLNRVAEAKKIKANSDRQLILNKISGVTLNFKMAAGDSDRLFGTVTTTDISRALEKQGFSVDRRDILLDEPIKILGQHKAVIKYSEGLQASIAIAVERA
ncbi:MAG: 50S ribosomal protein L9 [Bdellovibrionales bacterium]|nr:50S ribosomal protein L9 [Bdellovibrionales bacterium]MBL7669982.1 50S ribosomal protein L9 [Pseudobdellovibrionaceae bacterium]